ncbi:hypothetical protein ACJJTC_006692 [Scirpophaga incertulas]
MDKETIVSSRPDREIRKIVVAQGDYTLVPYEDSRCKIVLTNVNCKNDSGKCTIEEESKIFGNNFDGNVLIGDSDFFIDKDFELILQQMCCGEKCEATLVYRNSKGELVKEISCNIHLQEVTEEQLISDWSWQRLFEAATHHKQKGIQLVKEKRFTEAFRRFNKALKMIIAIEPVDPAVIDEATVKEITDSKIKLYNNLAYLQLQYHEYDAVLQLCDRVLKLDQLNVKALYRRSLAYSGLKMYEEAWVDVQNGLKLDPNDKAFQQQANTLKPILEQRNENYTNVIKKMFN